MNVQIIERNGKPEWAIIPYEEYERIREALDDAEDIRAIESFYETLQNGEEELLPAEFVDRILDGESPFRVWREHRGMTLQELGDRCGVSNAAISQVETGKRSPSVELLKKLAAELGVAADDLI